MKKYFALLIFTASMNCLGAASRRDLSPDEIVKLTDPTMAEKIVAYMQTRALSGLKGCARKEICEMWGHPDAKYSEEGLCKPCEFKQFPERFSACAFCRTPHLRGHAYYDNGYVETTISKYAYPKVCIDCVTGAEALVVNKIKVSDDESSYESPLTVLKDMAEEILQEQRRGHHLQPIPALADDKVTQAVFPNKSSKNLYLYRGALSTRFGAGKLHVWVGDIDTDESDRKLMERGKRKENKKHVRKFCHKYDIIGPQTGTILTSMPDHVVATYEERIKE